MSISLPHHLPGHPEGTGARTQAKEQVYVWLVDPHRLAVWPPLEVRREILDHVEQIPRGWRREALHQTLEQREIVLQVPSGAQGIFQ